MNELRTIVSAPELQHLLAEARGPGDADAPIVLDASFDLADPGAGERRFATAHIPGSRYAHLDRDLAGAKTGRNGRHPLPERAAFARTVGAWDIGPESRVVCLDAQGGAYAARLWWMLRWLGHQDVAVLDGGWKAWQEAGGALVATTSSVAAKPPYPERPSLVATADIAAVAARAANEAVLDARSADRFRGDNETIDPVGGHIPGALNRFYGTNVDANGRFKSPERLREELSAALGGRAARDVIHSCGSGVTACHNLLAMEHAGLSGSRLYPGSWSEWSSDPARPIARG